MFWKLLFSIGTFPKMHPSTWLGFWRIPFLSKWISLVRLKLRLPFWALRRHAYIVAKSGAGKSYFLYLIALVLKLKFLLPGIHQKRTLIILDPHGELVWECAKNRVFAGDVLRSIKKGKESNIVFLSAGLKKGIVPTLNPFDRQGKHDTPETRDVLAQYLTRTFASMLSRGDVKLSFNMEALLTPMITVLLDMSQEKQMTFHDLKRFLDPEQNTDLITYGAETITNEGINDFFRTTFHDPMFTTTKFSLKVKLSKLLNSPMFIKLLCQKRSSFDLETLMNTGKTILIDAAETQLGRETSEIYGRTITALIQSLAFLRARQRGRKYTPVFFILDEAARFMSSDIETILTQARKFGLHLILANQIAKQGRMSTELYESIMGNTALKITGNAGAASKGAMSTEMEIPLDDVKGLTIGNFVIKADGRKPERIRLPGFWIGGKQECSSSEWRRIQKYFLKKYYTKIPEISTQAQLQEKQPAITEKLSKSIKHLPKFKTSSPFIFSSLSFS